MVGCGIARADDFELTYHPQQVQENHLQGLWMLKKLVGRCYLLLNFAAAYALLAEEREAKSEIWTCEKYYEVQCEERRSC